MQSRAALSAACFATVVALSLTSVARLSKPADANVGFTATGPAGLKIHGITTELDVVERGDAIVVTVPLGHLETGIALRDRHMKEKYLEVEKYPSTTLTIARATLKLPERDGTVAADVNGKLSLHGSERPVVVHYQANRSAGVITVKGTLGIEMDQFGITVPSYLGVTVKPGVEVDATFRVSAGEG